MWCRGKIRCQNQNWQRETSRNRILATKNKETWFKLEKQHWLNIEYGLPHRKLLSILSMTNIQKINQGFRRKSLFHVESSNLLYLMLQFLSKSFVQRLPKQSPRCIELWTWKELVLAGETFWRIFGQFLIVKRIEIVVFTENLSKVTWIFATSWPWNLVETLPSQNLQNFLPLSLVLKQSYRVTCHIKFVSEFKSSTMEIAWFSWERCHILRGNCCALTTRKTCKSERQNNSGNFTLNQVVCSRQVFAHSAAGLIK